MIFQKDYEFPTNLISPSLYYSYDETSSIGANIEIISKLKIYDSFETEKYIFKELGEGYKEIKAIINCDKKLFVRIIINDENLIYDILIYTISSNDLYDKYCRIFFSERKIDLGELSNISDSLLLFENNDLIFVKNSSVFLKYIKFEDWDFANKHSNKLNYVISEYDKLLTSLNNKKDFKENIELIANGGDKINLTVSFIYKKHNNDFYIVRIEK